MRRGRCPPRGPGTGGAAAARVTPPLSAAPDTFWTNPQFRLTLLEPDDEEEDDDDCPRGGRIPKCTVLLSLIQRNRRRLRAQGLTYLSVGFHVFQVCPAAVASSWGAGEGQRQTQGPEEPGR